ncbi:hypothetical protein KR018_009199, partial [Drosophila ironensis]
AGYRLPRLQGRSASGGQEAGTGRDLFKKFMMMRGMFQQPESPVVVISPSTTTTTTTTPTSTPTTTTTTTTTTNSTGRALDNNVGRQLEPQGAVAVATFTGLEDRLDLPVAEYVEPAQPAESFRQKAQKLKQQKLKLKTLDGGRKKIHHRRRFLKKANRFQKKKHHKRQKPVNQRRSAEPSVDFIEPYHNDRSQSEPGQSGDETRLQRIWRLFQIPN